MVRLASDQTHGEYIRQQLRRSLTTNLKRKLSRDKHVDYLAWGKRFCSHYLTDVPSIFHEHLSSRLASARNKRNVKEVVLGPRGSAKSTFISFLNPLIAICEETEKFIILCADTETQAIKYLDDIKEELETNPDIQRYYPEAFGRGGTWNANRIVTKNRICVEALGSGSKIRGRRFHQHRPTLIIIDDPEGDDAAYSHKIRTRTWNWMTKGVLNAGGPGCNILVGGTGVHRECVVKRLETMPGWKASVFKAMIEWPSRMDLWDEWEDLLANLSDVDREQHALEFYTKHRAEMDEGAVVLWPSREPLYELMLHRATLGHAAFESEKQNNPIDPSICEWDPSLINDPTLTFLDWPKDPECKVMALDPSKGKESKAGDYQALVFLAVKDGLLYVDSIITRVPITQLVETMINYSVSFQPDLCVCEDNQFQELIISEIEAASNRQELLCPVEGISNYGASKLLRIRRLSPYITRRRVRFRRGTRGNRLLLDMLMDFPNGAHDDGPDAFEMAVRTAARLLSMRKRRPITNPR